MILLIMESTEGSESSFTHLAIGIESQVTLHVAAMDKLAEQDKQNTLYAILSQL